MRFKNKRDLTVGEKRCIRYLANRSAAGKVHCVHNWNLLQNIAKSLATYLQYDETYYDTIDITQNQKKHLTK